jgi:hypothetical protein
MTKLAAVLSALIAGGAGLYMLNYSTQENSILNVMSHGIGAYFLARAIFMGASLWRQGEATDRLGMLVDFAAQRHVRDSAEPAGEDFSGLPPT